MFRRRTTIWCDSCSRIVLDNNTARYRRLGWVIVFAASGLLLPFQSAAVGAVLYWDTNGEVAGCGTGDGEWSGANWSTDSIGTRVTELWTYASDAVFSAGSDAVGRLAVSTAGGDVSIGDLTVEEGDVGISGSGSINIVDDQIWTVYAGSSLSMASNIVNSNSGTLTINSLGDTNLSGDIHGKGKLTKTGAGTLTLSGANDLADSNDGLLVSSGAVLVPSGSIEANIVRIDGSGAGLTLSGGSLNLGYGLFVGGPTGTPCTFQMTGGTLTCAQTYGVGSGNNTPSISQSGGIAEADTLKVGVRYTYNQVATYTLSGTASLQSRQAFVGCDYGRGHFLQEGGTHTVTEYLVLGDGASAYGYYQLDDGTLNTGSTFVIDAALQQNGGIFNAGHLDVAYDACFSVIGGTLNIPDSAYIGGDIYFGRHGASVSVGGIANFSGATILGEGNTTFTVEAESLAIFPAGFDPGAFFDSFSNYGLVTNLGDDVNIAAGNVVRGTGTIADHVYLAGSLLRRADYLAPRSSYNDSIDLKRGITVDGGVAYLGPKSRLTVNERASGITSGELQAASIWMGHNADGRFVQSGGTVATDAMLMGMGNQNSKPKPQVYYEISDGSLSVTNNLEVAGYRSIADFVQTGGTVAVGDELQIGSGSDGAQGTYRISGGSLSAATIQIGDYSTIGVLEVIGGDAAINAEEFGMGNAATLISHVQSDGLSTIEAYGFRSPQGNVASMRRRFHVRTLGCDYRVPGNYRPMDGRVAGRAVVVGHRQRQYSVGAVRARTVHPGPAWHRRPCPARPRSTAMRVLTIESLSRMSPQMLFIHFAWVGCRFLTGRAGAVQTLRREIAHDSFSNVHRCTGDGLPCGSGR